MGARLVSSVWGGASRSPSDPEPGQLLSKNLPQRDNPGKIGKIHPKRSLTKRLNTISLEHRREKAAAGRSRIINLGTNPSPSPLLPAPSIPLGLHPAFSSIPGGFIHADHREQGQVGDGPSAGDIRLQTHGRREAKESPWEMFLTLTWGILAGKVASWHVWGWGERLMFGGEPPPLG